MRTDGRKGMTKLIVAFLLLRRRLKAIYTEFLINCLFSKSLPLHVLILLSLLPLSVFPQMKTLLKHEVSLNNSYKIRIEER